MSDIIARLETATEGSRELDAEIGRMFGAPRYTRNAPNIPNQPVWPNYTTSIDAALALVPEGVKWWSILYEAAQAGDDLGNLPLAICIAALRARLLAKGETP
jgi:hypothetical protein